MNLHAFTPEENGVNNVSVGGVSAAVGPLNGGVYHISVDTSGVCIKVGGSSVAATSASYYLIADCVYEIYIPDQQYFAHIGAGTETLRYCRVNRRA